MYEVGIEAVCSDANACTKAANVWKEDGMDEISTSEVLDAIRAFVKAKGYAPTVRDLATELERGHSTIQKAILALARDGKINRTPGVARSITVNGGAK
jgi:SOS-response transcriptional repressor LexA